MAMTDPSEWAGHLSAESGPCLQDLDLFSQEIAMVHGDKDRRRVAVITLMQEYIQLPKGSVRAYANHVKGNWRQLGGIYTSMKKSSTIMPGQVSATLSRTKLDQWRPPGADLTPWTKSSIWQRPRKSHMSKTGSGSSSSNSSRNTSRNSLRTRHPKAANEATGHPSLSHLTPKAANPANQDETNTANQVAKDNRPAYRQHHGSQQKSSKANVLAVNAHDADLRTRRWASSLNTHEEVTHRKSRTRH